MPTAIIYGQATGIIRRIIVSDEPSTFAAHIASGEAFIAVSDDVLVPRDDGSGQLVPSLDLAYGVLTAATGIDPECSRCLVIEDASAEVRSVIQADPTLDVVAGHTLYQDLDGDVGYLPDAEGNFTIPPSEV